MNVTSNYQDFKIIVDSSINRDKIVTQIMQSYASCLEDMVAVAATMLKCCCDGDIVLWYERKWKKNYVVRMLLIEGV